MTDKQIIIYKKECYNEPHCSLNQVLEQLKAKEQELKELRQYHNKCCEEFEKEKKEWLEKYNQISRGFYNGDYCNTKHCSLLKAKEQECEELKKELHKNFEEKDTLHLIIDRLLEASGYDTNTASAEDFEDVYEHMRYEQQQLDQLKAENDTYKKMLEDGDFILALTEIRTGERHLWYNKAQKLEQTLTEIKEVLQFYNNSKIGTDKGNGIFEFEVSNDNVLGGKLIYCYDTNPAKKALQKISEVEDG